MPMNQSREIHTGKYTFDGNLTRLCTCGHSLGNHAAERGKFNGKMFQDCFVDTFSEASMKNSENPFYQEVYRHILTGKKCDCMCFKPKKIK